MVQFKLKGLMTKVESLDVLLDLKNVSQGLGVENIMYNSKPSLEV